MKKKKKRAFRQSRGWIQRVVVGSLKSLSGGRRHSGKPHPILTAIFPLSVEQLVWYVPYLNWQRSRKTSLPRYKNLLLSQSEPSPTESWFLYFWMLDSENRPFLLLRRSAPFPNGWQSTSHAIAPGYLRILPLFRTRRFLQTYFCMNSWKFLFLVAFFVEAPSIVTEWSAT